MASAPDAEKDVTLYLVFRGENRHIVIDRAGELGFKPVLKQDVRQGMTVNGIVNDGKWMMDVKRDDFIQIRAKGNDLFVVLMTDKHFDRNERNIINVDFPHFIWRDQPEPAFGIFSQHRGKQADEFFALDRRAVVVPDTISVDVNA